LSQGTRESVAPRLIASLTGLITAISLILVSALVTIENRRLDSALEEQAEATADRLATTLSFPVWNAISREIDVQLDWAMLDPAVYGASLTMSDLTPALRARSRDGTWTMRRDPPGERPGLIVAERSVVYEGRSIASLELLFTRRFVGERIAREALLFAALVLVEDLTIAIGLLLVLRSSIFLPLWRIESWAEGVSLGNASTLPPADRARGEIESLRSSIERMVTLLGDRYGAIVAKEKEFRSLFESSPVPTVELDFSALRAALAEDGPGKGIRPRLLADPELASRLLALVKAKSANPSALALLGDPVIASIPVDFSPAFGEDGLALFIDELAALAEGSRGATGECSMGIGPGGERRFILDFATLASHEADWSRVILTMTDISPRALAEARLRQALTDKEALVQELYHRTRNNLQVLAGLALLRESRLSDEEARTELRGLGKRIQAMALAQDQLHKLGDLSSVDLGAYMRDLLPLVADGSGKRISIAVEAESFETVIDVAMPLGLVLVELESNALEHAFPNGRAGEISASLGRESDGCVLISMSDDGIGPPPGFDPRRDASLGLELVFTLVEHQLKGKVEFDFSSGFRCSIRFGVECFERRV
jgi:two-component sensor histidine kinase/HAMP domain-containing protein